MPVSSIVMTLVAKVDEVGSLELIATDLPISKLMEPGGGLPERLRESRARALAVVVGLQVYTVH